jgi:6-phosphogluconolactonase
MASVLQSLVIGTYTEKMAHVDGHADGILSAHFDGISISAPVVAAEVTNPSWLTSCADGRLIYAVIETAMFEGEPSGGVAAYARNPNNGRLEFLNKTSSAGAEPAHLALDPRERFLLVANYGGGSVSVFNREKNGGLGEMVEHVQHTGSSAHPVRQTSPHTHQILFDPVTGNLLVPDLGLDAVFVYQLGDTGALRERSEARINTAPGAGPRHLAFHPDGRHLFLLNELDNTVVVLRRTGDRFEQVQVASTLPADFKGHNQTSEIRVSNSGNYVLAANRGHDSIAVFAFDKSTSTVELKLIEPTLGRQPRDFVQSPDGGALIVGNQDSDTVVVFAFDERTPRLTFVSQTSVPTPVCFRFFS